MQEAINVKIQEFLPKWYDDNILHKSITKLEKMLEMAYSVDKKIVLDITECEHVPYDFIFLSIGKVSRRYGDKFKKTVEFTFDSEEPTNKVIENKFKSIF